MKDYVCFQSSVIIVVLGCFSFTEGACTFQAPFAQSSWHDNTKGTLTFTSSYMSGWSFSSYSRTYDSWECLDSSRSDYLVMRSNETLVTSGLEFQSYLCLKLTKITDFSYQYYQMHDQQQNAGEERIQVFDSSATVTASDVCNYGAPVPTLEFHLLVRTGYEAQAAIDCPTSLMAIVDYSVTNADGTSYCEDTNDVLDVCSNVTEMTFNYTTCPQTVAYTDAGRLWCVSTMTYGGYDYAVVYNQDNPMSSAAKKFACLSTDGSHVSIAPNNCTANQVPGEFPLDADGITKLGHLLNVTQRYRNCVPVQEEGEEEGIQSDSSNVAIIAGLIVGAVVILGIIFAVVIYVVFIKKAKEKAEEKDKMFLKEGENKVKLKNGLWVSGFGGAIPPTHTELYGLPLQPSLERARTMPILPSSRTMPVAAPERSRSPFLMKSTPLKTSSKKEVPNGNAADTCTRVEAFQQVDEVVDGSPDKTKSRRKKKSPRKKSKKQAKVNSIDSEGNASATKNGVISNYVTTVLSKLSKPNHFKAPTNLPPIRRGELFKQILDQTTHV